MCVVTLDLRPQVTMYTSSAKNNIYHSVAQITTKLRKMCYNTEVKLGTDLRYNKDMILWRRTISTNVADELLGV